MLISMMDRRYKLVCITQGQTFGHRKTHNCSSCRVDGTSRVCETVSRWGVISSLATWWRLVSWWEAEGGTVFIELLFACCQHLCAVSGMWGSEVPLIFFSSGMKHNGTNSKPKQRTFIDGESEPIRSSMRAPAQLQRSAMADRFKGDKRSFYCLRAETFYWVLRRILLCAKWNKKRQRGRNDKIQERLESGLLIDWMCECKASSTVM